MVRKNPYHIPSYTVVWVHYACLICTIIYYLLYYIILNITLTIYSDYNRNFQYIMHTLKSREFHSYHRVKTPTRL